MTKETLTLTAIIAECKRLNRAISSAINESDFTLIDYYFDYSKYVGARNVEQQETLIKSRIQAISALQNRLDALTKARIKANSETMVEVPESLTIAEVFSGKQPAMEKISIAEAINRKYNYKILYNNVQKTLRLIFSRDMNKKLEFQNKADFLVQQSLDRLFPASVNNAQKVKSSEKEEAEARERKINEVKTLDPFNLLETNAVETYCNMITSYISQIDTTLSSINASTKINIEY